jgi:hypothetical protein
MDADILNTILIIIEIGTCIFAIFMIIPNEEPNFIDIDYSFNLRNKILNQEK